MTAGEVVHGLLCDVEACSGAIDPENKDALALVSDFVTCSALRIVPSGNVLATAGMRESRDLALGLPFVLWIEQLVLFTVWLSHVLGVLVMSPFEPSEQETAVRLRDA